MKKLLFLIISLMFSWYVPSFGHNEEVTSFPFVADAIRYITQHKDDIDFSLIAHSLCEKIAPRIVGKDDLSRANKNLSLEEKEKLLTLMHIARDFLNYSALFIEESKGEITAEQNEYLNGKVEEFKALYQDESTLSALKKTFGDTYNLSLPMNDLTENEFRLWWLFISDFQQNLGMVNRCCIFVASQMGNGEALVSFAHAFPYTNEIIKLKYTSLQDFFEKEKPFFIVRDILIPNIDSLIQALEA